uniref:Ubiquitin carboxyl-terminal hydrolase 14 n=1 Tax=Panagrellus redivivus TaxID=6233 RepID=A0A7E4UQB2_PANRE
MCSAILVMHDLFHVRYTEREDTILSVPVPLDQAEEVAVTGSTKRKVIALDKCLEAAFGEEIIENFESPITKERGVAKSSTSLKTFPDFLALQVRRFGYNDDYTVKKLDVDVLFDEVINLERFSSKGPQPGEKLLPEDVNAEFVPHVNEKFVQSLLEMGIGENAARKAVYVTENSSIEAATEWFFNHMDDADINEVHRDLVRGTRATDGAAPAVPTADVNSTQVNDLVALGFPPHKAKYALRENNGDVNEAANWLFMNADTLPDDPPPETVEAPREPRTKNFSNGRAVYRLIGVISHMGSSPHCGHYVAHVKRGDKWYLFNDEKVAVSQNPPISLGYIYLLERKPE